MTNSVTKSSIAPSDNSTLQRQEPSYPSAIKGYSTTLILLLIYCLSLLDRNIISALAPAIQSDLNVSDTDMGFIYGGAFAIAYGLGAIPFGWAVDRYPRRAVIGFGVLCWSAATVFCGLARTYTQLLIPRAFVGLGEAAIIPASYSLLPDMFPPSRLSFPFSIFSLGAKVGHSFAFLIVSLLTVWIIPTATVDIGPLWSGSGWQLILIIVGLGGAPLALLTLFVYEPARVRPVTRRNMAAEYMEYLQFVRRNLRFFVPHHTATAIMMAVATGLISWLPTLMFRDFGWEAGKASFWIGICLLVGPVGGMPLAGMLADRLHQRGVAGAQLRVLSGALLVGGIIAPFSYMTDNGFLCLLGIGIFLAVTACFTSLAATSMLLVVPDFYRGRGTTVQFLVCGMVGTTVGPLLVGLMTDGLFGAPMSTAVGFQAGVAE